MNTPEHNPNVPILIVHFPALGKDVVLFKQTWEEHIIVEHPEVATKKHLIDETIKKCTNKDDIFQKIDNPKKISVQRNVPDFLPLNPFFRVTMKELKHHLIITSAYPADDVPKEGVKKYES